MKLYRCRICGDPYLGEAKPSNCPFCGAPAKYMVLASEYEEPVIEALSEVSRKNLEKALGLEVDNTQFYSCSSKRANDLEGEALFKALSKIESEHASTISKMLKVPKPAIDLESKECHPTYAENLEESHKREKRAVDFYQRAAEEAVEPRVMEVFTALVEIESDHIALSGGGME